MVYIAKFKVLITEGDVIPLNIPSVNVCACARTCVYMRVYACMCVCVKITPTCFMDHKMGNIALIYKSFKTVQF